MHGSPVGLSRSQRLLALLLCAASGAAHASGLGKDVSGGKDHPLLSRFAGSQLIGYQQLEFDQGTFYLPSKDPYQDVAKELDRDSPLKVEGRVTRLVYIAPPGKTPLEVHRNFEQALKGAGLKTLTSVDGRNAWWSTSLHWNANFHQANLLPPFAADVEPFDRNGLYLYGTLVRGETQASVSVLTGPASPIAKGHYKVSGETALTAVAIQIVEAREMETGQVIVSMEQLKESLASTGRIALYGIYFDTGSAELKPESKEQLEEMARLLRQQPSLRVHIVGHTDNTGTLESNKALSERRARAVVNALVSSYRIDAKRLSAFGAASYSPVASNQTESGRAKNRRVEMVEQ